MARPRRDAQTIAQQLDSLVEELKETSTADEATASTEPDAELEVTPEVTAADWNDAHDVGTSDATPQVNLVEPAAPEEPPLSATTLAEIEAGRAALARNRT